MTSACAPADTTGPSRVFRQPKGAAEWDERGRLADDFTAFTAAHSGTYEVDAFDVPAGPSGHWACACACCAICFCCAGFTRSFGLEPGDSRYAHIRARDVTSRALVLCCIH